MRELRFVPPDKSITLPIKVNGHAVHAVVDTAGQVTVISDTFFSALDAKLDREEPILLKGVGVDSCMRAKMVHQLSLTLGNQSFLWSCCVAPITDPMILGLDFLECHKAVIDLPARILHVGGSEIPLTMSGNSEAAARLIRKTTVEPHSQVQTWCSAPSGLAASAVLVPAGQDVGIEIPPLLVSSALEVPVLLINHTNRYITLTAGTVVAQIEPIASSAFIHSFSPDDSSSSPCVTVRKQSTSAAESSLGSKPAVPEHLTSLLENSSKGLSTPETQALASLLSEFRDVFAESDSDLGCFPDLKHTIDTGDAAPIKERMRRTPLGFEHEEDKHLDNMLRNHIIRPSNSPWSAAPVLIRKRDGSVRWCLDYRRLNDVTRKDLFPLPLIEECIDTLAGSVFFSTLDMASGYWQVEVEERDKPKTAFITKRGLFEMNRMAFGLCNAPATFQRMIQTVLEGLLWWSVLAYIDDVIVLGPSFADHLKNLEIVLRRFRRFNLKLKPKKCHLFRRQVKFLGRVVSQDGIAMDPAKIQKIVDWPTPTSPQEVSSFLGLANYHREHIEGFAQITAPLYRLVKKGTVFEWTKEAQRAFEALKVAMTSAPILAYPLPEGRFILDTDASHTAIGAELSQEQDGGIKVIAYGSYALTAAQRNYCTTRKELLAVVRFTRQFRHYLLGRPFLVRTDHNSLTWLMRFRQTSGQLARWLEELSQYDFSILHRAGAQHCNADALSRIPLEDQRCDCYQAGARLATLPCNGCRYCTRVHEQWSQFEEDVDDVVPLALRAVTVIGDDPSPSWLRKFSQTELRTLQEEDPDLKPLFEWLSSNPDPTQGALALASPVAKALWHNRQLLALKEGVLYYEWHPPQSSRVPSGALTRICLVVPHCLREEVMRLCHDLPSSGHFSSQGTLNKLRQHFFWPSMSKDCQLFVAACPECGRNKKASVRPRAPLGSYHAGGVMERVHLDILGPLPKSGRGNVYILVVVDQFSKWTECFALPDQMATTVATTVVNEFFCRLGCPSQIHTDQGTNFESVLFTSLCELLRIAKTRTTPYRPRSNGQVERINRSILQMVRCFLQGNQLDWDRFLPQLAGAIRGTVNRSTGFTPNMVMLGREVSLPATLLQLPSRNPTNLPEYLLRFQEVQRQVHEAAREHLQGAQQYQKSWYDSKAKITAYEVGDLAYLSQEAHKPGTAKKLCPVRAGPFLITKVLSPFVFQIRGPRRVQTVHHDRLQPFRERAIPLWVRRARHALLGGNHDADLSCEESRAPPPTNPPSSESLSDGVLEDIRFLFHEEEETAPKKTRAGRASRRPAHLQDFCQ